MDHHPKEAEVPIGAIEYRTMYRGYIPSARSAYELCGGKKWMSLVGVIIDVGFLYKENDEFIKDALSEVDKTREEFEDTVAFPISNMILYLNEEPEKAFNLIKNIPNYNELDSIKEYSKPIEDEMIQLFYIDSMSHQRNCIGGKPNIKENKKTI